MGYRIVDCPDAAVIHPHNYDRRALIRRCVSEGYGWRTLNESYTLWDAARDMMHPAVYRRLLGGMARGQIRTSAELFFPWIRPVALYYGNRHALGVQL
jgi:hypothetical protein